MPAKLDNLHKLYKGRIVAKGEQELINDNICPDCLEKLPEPIYENREGGYSEQITYCSCGATFIGEI